MTFDGDLGDVVRRAWRHYGARPYDVGDNAPDTVERLIACDVERAGTLRIWPGGTDSAIYSAPEVNYMFRAWHDNCHLTLGGGFTGPEEIELGERQRALAARFGDAFAEIVHCEISGQAEFYIETGRFLEDQRAFTSDYLAGVDWRSQLHVY